MAVKFSAFTTRTGTLDASTKIVGYDDPAGTKTNVEFSLATLAANSGIYAADGTIGTTRKALITDTIQFRNAGDTSDILKLNTDGTFSLGDGASSTLATQVAIGRNAAVGSSNAVAIGNNATASYSNSVAIGNSAGATYDSISIGSSSSSGSNGISMGQSSAATGNGVAIGYDAEAPAASVGLGANAKGTGANSITLNSNGGVAAPSTANAFGVYMSSNTIPDFEVIGGGESTLNTSLKITGQGYTEQHDQTGVTIDWDNSNVVYATLVSGSQTFTPINPKSGATYILYLRQPGAGAAGTVNWNSLALWSGGTAPTLTATNGATDVITLIYNGTSTKYFGTSVLNFS
ncbi:MAG: hypothetical protein GY787_14965 [Alteromonadales bacterium]|nr:hypothetical protein [Alteromonadales bacterium]